MPASTRSARSPACSSPVAHDVDTLARALNAQLPEDLRVRRHRRGGRPTSTPGSARARRPTAISCAPAAWRRPSIARSCGTCRSASTSTRCARPRTPSSARTTSRRSRASGRASRTAFARWPAPTLRTEGDLLVYESHGRRLPPPHGSRHRRHARGGRPRMATAGQHRRAARGRHAAHRRVATAPPHGLFLVRVDYD